MTLTQIELNLKLAFRDLENHIESLKKEAPDAAKIIDEQVRRRAGRLALAHVPNECCCSSR